MDYIEVVLHNGSDVPVLSFTMSFTYYYHDYYGTKRNYNTGPVYRY